MIYQGFWNFADKNNPEFQMFSLQHMVTIIISIVVLYGFYKISPKIKKSPHEKWIRYGIAIFMIGFEYFLFRKIYHLGSPWYEYIPDATCGWSIYLGSIMLLTKNEKMFKVLFFFGFGAVLSFLFPDTINGPARFEFYRYFISHLFIFISGFYMIWVLDYKLYKRDWLYSVKISMPIIVFVTIINLIINNPEEINFFYTLQPPVSGTPLDLFMNLHVMFYAVIWLMVASLMGYLYALPFYHDKKEKKSLAINSMPV